jgi:two-component system chemotaxis response regulator CheB
MGTMSKKVSVLVVDDSAYSRQAIKGMLETDPDIGVVEIATDGMDAMSKAMKLKPDIITLDLEMPEMDGFSFLRWVMQQMPVPVIMVSSHADSKTVFKALELGAVDFVEKPSKRATVELMKIEKDLLAKVKGIQKMNMDVLGRNLRFMEQRSKEAQKDRVLEAKIELVAIGTSTGGPPALQFILQDLPPDFSSGIVISQHMPKGFTKPMSERLDEIVTLHVKEAEEGEVVREGAALVCPGGYHMSLNKRGGKVRVALKEASLKDKYVPSVDVMMKSAADIYGSRMMGVVLTGMGNDGKKGMVEVQAKGGLTIAESDETAVVYGMPAEVVKAGAAKRVLPLYNIPRELLKHVMGERRLK